MKTSLPTSETWRSDRATSILFTLATPETSPLASALKGIPRRFHRRVELHMTARKLRNGGLPLLGEVAPGLVENLIATKMTVLEHPMIVAWWQLYFAVIIIDDILDETDSHHSQSLLLPAMLLQQRGVTTIATYAATTPELRLDRSLQVCFDSMSVSADQEIQQDGKVQKPECAKLLSIAEKKLALLELLSVLICACHSASHKQVHLLINCIRRLAIVSQLLDDITDAPEDHANGHRTLITSPLLDQSGAKSEAFLSLERMIDSGALEHGLQLAFDECGRAIDALHRQLNVTEGSTSVFMASLFEGIKDAMSLAHKARKAPPHRRTQILSKLHKRLSVLSFMS